MANRKETSTNSINKDFAVTNCDSLYTLEKIGGRWKIMIMFNLRQNDKLRFNELRDKVTGITDRMLSLQLKELEADGLIFREVFAEVPPKVEYSLMPIAIDLLPVINALEDWGAKHRSVSSEL